MADRTLLKRVFAAIWTICLIVASLQPFRPDNTKGPYFYRHQILHVLIFGATALLYRTLTRRNWVAFAAVFLLAISIESAQFALYRMPEGLEWWDVRDDSLGAAAALLISSLL